MSKSIQLTNKYKRGAEEKLTAEFVHDSGQETWGQRVVLRDTKTSHAVCLTWESLEQLREFFLDCRKAKVVTTSKRAKALLEKWKKELASE